jgi:hypothetical protein
MTRTVGGVAARLAAAVIAPLLLILAGCSNGPGGDPADADAPSPLLYEIAAADGTVEGWMFGTIHALAPDTEWRTPAIGRVIDAADLLVVEVAALGDGEGMARTFSALATTPGLPPLAERVPADLRPRLAALMARGALDETAFAPRETWAAAIMLAQIDATGDPANGVDRALIADFAGRPVRELEGARGQLAIFDRLPEAQQRAMLAAVVRESEWVRQDPARLQRAWLAGDAAMIEAATREGFLADPALREALLTARNRRWAAALARALAEAPRPLIAVGAAHLVGAEGLAALLAAEGYRLRRIP